MGIEYFYFFNTIIMQACLCYNTIIKYIRPNHKKIIDHLLIVKNLL